MTLYEHWRKDLQRLHDASSTLSLEEYECLRTEASQLARDFYAVVTAYLLEIDYHDVMAVERYFVKNGLFFHSYIESVTMGSRSTAAP